MGDRRRSGKSNDASDSRNRRMFASIQSALGTPKTPSGRVDAARLQKATPSLDVTAEFLDNVDDLIEQIADLSVTSSRSAIQIKRNITACEFLDEIDFASWSRLCEALAKHAMDQDEAAFIVDIIGSLLAHEEFQTAMIDTLEDLNQKCTFKSEVDKFPQFVGAILCGRYPREYSRSSSGKNKIMAQSLAITRGWLTMLRASGGTIYEPAEQPLPSDDDDSSVDEPGFSKPEPKISDLIHNDEISEILANYPEAASNCATSISNLCASAQRSLWMQQPQLCDEIYEIIRPAICKSINLPGTVKENLLATLLLLHAWTAGGAKTLKTSATQTCLL